MKEQWKQSEEKAQCLNCHLKFTEWLSDSKECPECEGEVMFFDCMKQQIQEKLREEWSKFTDDDLKNPSGLSFVIMPDDEKTIADWWLEKLALALKEQRSEIVEEIEKCFAEFRLEDWSGEPEVEAELNRLRKIIIISSIIKEK